MEVSSQNPFADSFCSAELYIEKIYQRGMFDSSLRATKDRVFDPLSRLVPKFVTPLFITGLAFLCGLTCCAFASYGYLSQSLTFWVLNRLLDCLDGAVARQQNRASDLGGFLDLLGDFIIYSLIPICCGLSSQTQHGKSVSLWLSIAVVEASFHINNFILFYVAAVIEKQKASNRTVEDKTSGLAAAVTPVRVAKKNKELTSIAMRPTLIEGAESAVLFTLMLARPVWLEQTCWLMATLVGIGILDRTMYIVKVMKD